MKTKDRHGKPLALDTIFRLQQRRLAAKLESSVQRIAAAAALCRAADEYDVSVRGVHGGVGGQSRPRGTQTPESNPLAW